MSVHELKCLPEFYCHLERGEKTFEARKDDRGFRAGDSLRLREWSKKDGYSGREMTRQISYILGGLPWLHQGYVILGLADERRAMLYAPLDGTEIEVTFGMPDEIWHAKRNRGGWSYSLEGGAWMDSFETP